VAERFLGVSYVWGGKTAAGLDCSSLIQIALQTVGKAVPRDTDMMEKALGDTTPMSDLRRGDLIFWKGHMGVMLDEERLLHANAFHMAVVIEPLAAAVARIEKVAGPVTAVKRL
jgi:cell wall-associated NlpC family hydrolase